MTFNSEVAGIDIYSTYKPPNTLNSMKGTYNGFIEQLIDKHKILPYRIFIENPNVIFDDTGDSL